MSRPPRPPLALGALALAAATILISSVELEWVLAPGLRVVALALIAFTAPLQLIVSLLAFARRDLVVGTGMAVLSATWLCVGLVMLVMPPMVGNRALGTFLLVCAGTLVVPGTAAATARRFPALLLLMASARLALAGLYSLAGGSGLRIAAGVLGLVLAALAMVVAASEVRSGSRADGPATEPARERTVVGRAAGSRTSIERLVQRVRQQL